MYILFSALCYLTFHFAFYVILGRRIKYFSTEGGIFKYHFISFCFAAVVSTCMLCMRHMDDIIIIELAVLSMHGIYSLTFLEFWSLSQGGYSISILRSSPINLEKDSNELNNLEAIGNDKLTNRLDSLKAIKMLTIQDNKVISTRICNFVTLILSTFVTLTNSKDIG